MERDGTDRMLACLAGVLEAPIGYSLGSWVDYLWVASGWGFLGQCRVHRKDGKDRNGQGRGEEGRQGGAKKLCLCCSCFCLRDTTPRSLDLWWPGFGLWVVNDDDDEKLMRFATLNQRAKWNTDFPPLISLNPLLGRQLRLMTSSRLANAPHASTSALYQKQVQPTDRYRCAEHPSPCRGHHRTEQQHNTPQPKEKKSPVHLHSPSHGPCAQVCMLDCYA